MFYFFKITFRSEDLIIPESMAQGFGFTVVLGKQAHSWLRNCLHSMAVGPKDQSDSGIIEFSFLSTFYFWAYILRAVTAADFHLLILCPRIFFSAINNPKAINAPGGSSANNMPE